MEFADERRPAWLSKTKGEQEANENPRSANPAQKFIHLGAREGIIGITHYY
jgi:hypothetical protein